MNRLPCLLPVIITAVTAISAFAQNPLLGPPGAPPTGPATIPGEAVVTPAKPPEPDFPKPEEALKGYEKVVSTADGRKSFCNVWSRGKDQQLLAELPAAYDSQRHYLALTVASGDAYAGLQAGEVYFYWKNYGKRLAMVTPSVAIRSTGDKASQDSIKRLFTDRVVLDIPIVTQIPQGGPVIDLDELVVKHAEKFFGLEAKGLEKGIYIIKSAKAFPSNIEIAVEGPTTNGQLRTFHFSLGATVKSCRVIC